MITDDHGYGQVPTPTAEQIRDGVRATNEWIIHPEHHRDTLCLICFNRGLRAAPWTFKPGQRYVKVGRYVSGKSGRMYMRHTNYEAGRGGIG